MRVLALDIGTASTRAVLLDEEPRARDRAGVPTPLVMTPDGGAELDPGTLRAAVEEVLDSIADRAEDVGAVTGSRAWMRILADVGAEIVPDPGRHRIHAEALERHEDLYRLLLC